MDITITLTDDQLADLQAEIAALDEPRPTVAEFLRARVDQHIVTPITTRQQQYREGRAFERVRTLLPKLVRLTPEQQAAVQAQAEAAIDTLLGE